jgi:hypothetical protein
VQGIDVFFVFGAMVYPVMPEFEIIVMILLSTATLASPVLSVGSSPFDQPVVRGTMGDCRRGNLNGQSCCSLGLSERHRKLEAAELWEWGPPTGWLLPASQNYSAAD